MNYNSWLTILNFLQNTDTKVFLLQTFLIRILNIAWLKHPSESMIITIQAKQALSGKQNYTRPKVSSKWDKYHKFCGHTNPWMHDANAVWAICDILFHILSYIVAEKFQEIIFILGLYDQWATLILWTVQKKSPIWISISLKVIAKP